MKIHCSHTSVQPIEKLVPNPRNPNTHPPEQLRLLAKIIAAQGWRSPIVVSKRSGFIVKGHGRLEAARIAGLTEAPVDEQDYADEATEWADLIADNRLAELAEIDSAVLKDLLVELDTGAVDMDLTGFTEDALEQLMTQFHVEEESDIDAEAQTDRADELAEKWKVKQGQVWQLGEHRVMCGDSTDEKCVRLLTNGEKVGLCFTSPPYDQQRDYKAESKEKLKDWGALMRGVFACLPMQEDGQVLVNLGLIHRDGEWVPYWEKWIEWMREQGWRRFGWYVWDQGPGMPGDWSGRLAPSHEFIFHFTKHPKTAAKSRQCKHAGEAHGGKGQRGADGAVKPRSSGNAPVQDTAIHDSVLRVNRQGAQHDAEGHPAPYPPGLPAIAIQSWPSTTYDPFLGSGTTLIAAERLGRKCYGMEISPGYVGVILQRWADATGKQPKMTKEKLNG